ncbi:unnamed protein product, partial [Mycena citricolor]
MQSDMNILDRQPGNIRLVRISPQRFLYMRSSPHTHPILTVFARQDNQWCTPRPFFILLEANLILTAATTNQLVSRGEFIG